MKVTIVMYHYVRELTHSRYPRIKGLSTAEFREQIRYINKHYQVISGHELIAAVESNATHTLPPNALLLTFDDGYLDHFTQVLPILAREKITGCFFPPAKCVLENEVLDVNKIHFVLASVPDPTELVNHIFTLLDEYRSQYQLQSREYYWQKLAVAKRFDPPEVAFIKRLLQRELPAEFRRIVVNSLFHKYVSTDEKAFAKELYMSADQLIYLQQTGMYIGSHGHAHDWLDSLPPAEQQREIELSLDFLRQIGAPVDSWMMCYPYGGYNDTLLEILRGKHCRIGLTTKVGIADLRHDDWLTLPRLDTNDLPKYAGEQPNTWTMEATN